MANSNPKPPSDMPKCPSCGRRNTVRRLDADTHYCSQCSMAFTIRGH